MIEKNPASDNNLKQDLNVKIFIYQEKNNMEDILNMYATMGVSKAVYEYGEETLKRLQDQFAKIDKIAETVPHL